jgi:hypothetical protein
MTNIPNCWLWKETEYKLRWFSPQDTQLINMLPLDDNFSKLPLSSILPQSITDEISKYLRKSSVRLHIAKEVPDNWQRLPWDKFWLNDKNVSGDLLVSRYAQRSATHPPLPTTQKDLILNFWENEELFNGLFSDTTKIVEDDSARYFIEHNDLSAFSSLCVISHGNKQDNHKPFSSDDKPAWGLPLNRGLPPLVILLVCGNKSGNLFEYGQTLLEHGAKTVLAPLDELNAKQAEIFLREFLTCWKQGQCVDELLATCQHDTNSYHGAKRLYLLGYGQTRVTTKPQLDELSDADYPQILEGLTLQGCQMGWEKEWVRNIVPALFKHLQLEEEKKEDEIVLLRALSQCEPKLNNLTRSWVLPLIAYIAEYHDHSLLSYCQRTRKKLSPTAFINVDSFHQWSKLYYRNGYYSSTFQELAQGFKQAETNSLAEQSLLGSLCNTLLDINLPTMAEQVIVQLENNLSHHPDSQLQAFKLLDRKGHLALRSYQLDRAISCYRLKQQQAIQNYGEYGFRELAWLLYTTTWAGLAEEAANYASEAYEALSSVAEIEKNTGGGNDNNAYLLRALALWTWRNGNTDMAQRLSTYIPFIDKRLYSSQDPGPFAFTIAYLQLYQAEQNELTAKLPSWATIQAILENKKYWLELTSLHAFFGETEAAQKSLSHFHYMRNKAVESLTEIATSLNISADWQAKIETQTEREKAILVETPTIEAILKAGLLPL